MNIRRNYSLEEFGVKKHQTVLSNGLELIFIEKPYSPIHARIMMGAGSVFNPSDNGLAHFTEHMLVGASGKYPRKELIAQIINKVGGISNASTSGPHMMVVCGIPLPDHLPNMKQHFTQVLTDLYCTPALFNKEKGVISSEIEGKLSEPGYRIGRYMNRALVSDSPWGYSNLGELEAMQSLEMDDVVAFHAKHCVVENMTLIVAGGSTFDKIRKTFGSIPIPSGGERMVLPPDPLPLLPQQRLFYMEDVGETDILMGFQAPPLFSRESIILRFALEYAHGGLDSLFMNEIRNKRGLAYSASLRILDFGKLRYIGTTVGVPTNKTDETISVVLECYRKFIKTGMPVKEIKKRIDRSYFANRRYLERSVDWINEFDHGLFEEENPLIGDFPDLFNFYETITSEEISAVLKKYITLDNFHLFVVGREPSKKYM